VYYVSKSEIRRNYNTYLDFCNAKKVVPTSIITLVRKMFISKMQFFVNKLNESYETNEVLRKDKDVLNDKRFVILLTELSNGNYKAYDEFKQRFTIAPHQEIIINKLLEDKRNEKINN
jgi:hypothetical protein